NSLRASTKLVLIILLCLVEQQMLGFPGGAQVAFFSTFFASIGNLGRQTKTDLLGLFGLLSGFVYGVVAAFFTSRLPHFPLLLSLLFLGEFLANLAYQKLQRYNIAGRHGAALRLPGGHRSGVGLVRGGADAHCGDSRRWLHGDGRSRLSLAGAAHASAARVDRRRPAGHGGESGPVVRRPSLWLGRVAAEPGRNGHARARSARRRALPACSRSRRSCLWKSGVSSSFLPEKMNRHRITRIFCHCRGIGNTLR